jgi:hypothetical protein
MHSALHVLAPLEMWRSQSHSLVREADLRQREELSPVEVGVIEQVALALSLALVARYP